MTDHTVPRVLFDGAFCDALTFMNDPKVLERQFPYGRTVIVSIAGEPYIQPESPANRPETGPFPSDASLLSLPLHVALPLRFDLECYRNSIESCPSEGGDWMRAADVIEMLRKAGIGAEERL